MRKKSDPAESGILSQLPTMCVVEAQIESVKDELRKLETLRGALAAMEANYPSGYMPPEAPRAEWETK